jgi:hypothetical protein
MKIIYDTTEEKSEMCDIGWRIISWFRETLKNRPEDESVKFAELLNKLDHELVAGNIAENPAADK